MEAETRGPPLGMGGCERSLCCEDLDVTSEFYFFHTLHNSAPTMPPAPYELGEHTCTAWYDGKQLQMVILAGNTPNGTTRGTPRITRK